MTPRPDKSAFGEALARQLAAQGTQDWLARTLAEATGRPKPYDQSTVTRWAKGENLPDPETVFAIEELLQLPPGSLSRFLGYLPVTAVDAPVSVPAAVEADIGLTVMGRRLVLKVYEELVSEDSDGS